jgi:hypothetical protein
MTPEQHARKHIDELLTKAGWVIQNAAETNIAAGLGVAIREFPLPGHGFSDYLLYVDGKAAGVIEAKKAGATLSGVEIQADKYTQGLPPTLPAWRRPLPFAYQSTGTETRFTNGLDPEPRARSVFAFHRSAMFAAWLDLLNQPPILEPRPSKLACATQPNRLQPMVRLKPPSWSACAGYRILPPKASDIVVTDECHRSIYNLGAQVLEYFDAYLIGLTATPNKQTFGFFHQNLVMEYPHEQAVADGVNVNFDVYRIKTQFTGGGSQVEAGYHVERQDRDKSAGQLIWTHVVRPKGAGTGMYRHQTREKRWQQLDDFVKCYVPEARQLRVPTWTYEPSPHPSPLPGGEGTAYAGRWRAYDYEELVNRDKASLDIFWHKDESLEESDNLPQPGFIAAEIVEDLEAALEQFRAIAEDLGEGEVAEA